MFKNWKIFLLILALMFYIGCELESCWGVHNPVGPDPPEPSEEVEYYDWIVTYIRPAGSIVRSDQMDPTSLMVKIKNESNPRMPQFTKLDEYHFVAELNIPTHLKNDTAPSNYAYVLDPKRWIEMWNVGIEYFGRPHTVGDIFIFKNKKTGYEKQLMKIVPNPFYGTYLPPQCEPKADQFKTIKGGTIIDE